MIIVRQSLDNEMVTNMVISNIMPMQSEHDHLHPTISYLYIMSLSSHCHYFGIILALSLTARPGHVFTMRDGELIFNAEQTGPVIYQ